MLCKLTKWLLCGKMWKSNSSYNKRFPLKKEKKNKNKFNWIYNWLISMFVFLVFFIWQVWPFDSHLIIINGLITLYQNGLLFSLLTVINGQLSHLKRQNISKFVIYLLCVRADERNAVALELIIFKIKGRKKGKDKG